MKYQEIATDDVDQLFTWTSDFDSDVTQLTPGWLGFRCRNVKLPGVSMRWNSFDQSVLVRQAVTAPGLVFALVLHSTRPVSVRGLDVTSDEGFVFRRGVEHEYLVPRRTDSLIIEIAAPLSRRLDWRLWPHAMHRVPRTLLDRLVTVCEDVTAAAVMQEAGGVHANPDLSRERILVALRNAVEPWMSHPQSEETPNIAPSREYQLVKRAQQIMQAVDVDQRLRVPDLAAELGVSERLLYESFRKWLEIGPYEFHLRCRLHQFRDSLLTGKPHRGKIAQSAHLVGFHHMGRATQAFRLLFGETPRELMKRRSLSTHRAP